LEQANWRGMPYYDVLWRKRHLTLRELRDAYANYYTYVFWAMVVALLVLLDLHGFAERVSLTALFVYTLSLAVVTVSLYVFVTFVGIKISKKHESFFVIYPIVGLILMTIATYLVEAGMSSTFGGGLSFENVIEKLPANLILNVVLETLYLTFVLPVAAGSFFPEIAALAPTPNSQNIKAKMVVIAGHKFDSTDLVSLSSQDHYIAVKTQGGEQLIRARLSDVVEQLGNQDGIQPHRSHWVARKSVVEVENVEGQKRIKMTDGTNIPVARGRIASVQEWLEG